MLSTTQEKGFTLVELLITLLILMILVVIAVPSYQKFIEKERFTVAVNNFHNAYRYSRNEATKLAVDVTMAPVGSDWKNGWTVTYSAASETLLEAPAIHDSVTITTGTTELTVKSFGKLDANTQKITFSNTYKIKCLTILGGGQSELKDGVCN